MIYQPPLAVFCAKQSFAFMGLYSLTAALDSGSSWALPFSDNVMLSLSSVTVRALLMLSLISPLQDIVNVLLNGQFVPQGNNSLDLCHFHASGNVRFALNQSVSLNKVVLLEQRIFNSPFST